MAVYQCKECQHAVSDSAAAFPGCGAPIAVALGLPAAWVQTPSAPSPRVEAPEASQSPDPPRAAPIPTYVAPGHSATSQLAKAGLILGGLAVVTALALNVFDWAQRPDNQGASAPRPHAPAPVSPADRQARISELATGMENVGYSYAARIGRAERLVADYPDTPEAARARALIPELKAEAEAAKVGAQWTYSTFEDSMSGKQGASAYVESSNAFELDFPYEGRQRATLAVRQHPRYGRDVIFSLREGQILCGISECEVRVRFDEGPARTLSANEPADHSNDTLFLPASVFSKELGKAKLVRIEVNLYRQGVLLTEFDVSGFKAERLKPGKAKAPEKKAPEGLRS